MDSPVERIGDEWVMKEKKKIILTFMYMFRQSIHAIYYVCKVWRRKRSWFRNVYSIIYYLMLVIDIINA